MPGVGALFLPAAIGLFFVGAIWLFFWLFPLEIWFAGPRDRCPKCKSKDIRRTTITTFPDQVRTMFQVKPYRCRACWTTFSARPEKAHHAQEQSQG